MNDQFKRFFEGTTSSAPLAVFRIAFGLMLFFSILRFWLNNWIEELYIKPIFFFSYYGFEWIKPIGNYTYLLFFLCGLSALMVALGWKYRLSIITLFLSFTYIELMDKTTYLNHYYFVSLVCLVLVFLPANVCFSVDVWQNKSLAADKVPSWTINTLKLLLALVYFYAGLAKLNSDWLLNAMPLKLWLPSKNDLPILGPLLNLSWMPFLFSWLGAFYDLTVPFFLAWRKTRVFAYATVIVFHGLTAILFQIGMFPYVMIVVTLIFFSSELHQKIIDKLARFLNSRDDFLRPNKTFNYLPFAGKLIKGFLVIVLVIQLLFPFRYLAYPGELFWTEEGFRFSWRVMLMEKNGYATFYVHDSASDKKVLVNNGDFLTPLQEKMMATQADMIVQYAHFLKIHFEKQGFVNPEVYGDVFVTLNGRPNAQLIDPKVNLAEETDSFKHKSWILPFNHAIKGF